MARGRGVSPQLQITRHDRAAGDPRARMLAGVPVRERQVGLNGVSTTVLEGGDGPPLVLLHGGIECGGAYWAPVLAQLAECHHVVVPDLPGLGESEPIARLDVAAFEAWFAALIQETCEDPPVVIAHSLDGSLAAHFAAAQGERLRRLVLYAAPAIGHYRMPLKLRLTALRFGLRPTERNLERFERLAFFDLDVARRRDPEWLAAFSAYTRSRAVVPHVKRTMRQLIGVGTRQIPDAELRRIEVPTTLLWGRQDRFVALALAEAVSRRLGWSLRVIEDAGHVPHIEQAEAFLAALVERTG